MAPSVARLHGRDGEAGSWQPTGCCSSGPAVMGQEAGFTPKEMAHGGGAETGCRARWACGGHGTLAGRLRSREGRGGGAPLILHHVPLASAPQGILCPSRYQALRLHSPCLLAPPPPALSGSSGSGAEHSSGRPLGPGISWVGRDQGLLGDPGPSAQPSAPLGAQEEEVSPEVTWRTGDLGQEGPRPDRASLVPTAPQCPDRERVKLRGHGPQAPTTGDKRPRANDPRVSPKCRGILQSPGEPAAEGPGPRPAPNLPRERRVGGKERKRRTRRGSGAAVG